MVEAIAPRPSSSSRSPPLSHLLLRWRELGLSGLGFRRSQLVQLVHASRAGGVEERVGGGEEEENEDDDGMVCGGGQEREWREGRRGRMRFGVDGGDFREVPVAEMEREEMVFRGFGVGLEGTGVVGSSCVLEKWTLGAKTCHQMGLTHRRGRDGTCDAGAAARLGGGSRRASQTLKLNHFDVDVRRRTRGWENMRMYV